MPKSPYYFYICIRTIPGSSLKCRQPGLIAPQGFKPSSNPNLSARPIFRINDSMGPTLIAEESQTNMPQGITITVASTGVSLNEPPKKKRGRPRKSWSDGSGSGAPSASATAALGLSPTTLNSSSRAKKKKKKRGRPPVSGNKQRLSSVDDISHENDDGRGPMVNECPNQSEQTQSHENNRGLESPNHTSSNFGAPSMAAQPEADIRQYIASPNDSSKGSSKNGISNSRGLESPNHTSSKFGAQPMDSQPEDNGNQPIASQNHDDSPKGTSTNSFGTTRNSSHILQAITKKYQDITKECTLQSEFFKTHLLEGICKVVQKLQNTRIVDLKSDVKEFYKIIKDAETVKFDVKWLRQYVDDIVKTMEKMNELEKLEEKRREVQEKENELKEAIKMKKVEKEKLEYEIEQLEEQLVMESLTAEELTTQINSLPIPSFVQSLDEWVA